MNNLARKWIKALKSGKYKQGQRQLGNSKQGYCCLGVLQQIYSDEHHTPYRSYKLLPMRECLNSCGLTHDFSQSIATVNDLNEIDDFKTVIKYIERNKHRFESVEYCKKANGV